MAKQEIKRKETAVVGVDGQGKQLEQIYTLDDNYLPTPEELAAYQQIEPSIVPYLMELSKNEQAYRHESGREQMSLMKSADKRISRNDAMGIVFAFLALVVVAVLAGMGICFDQPWIATMFGAPTIITVVSIFLRRSNRTDSPKNSQQSAKKS